VDSILGKKEVAGILSRLAMDRKAEFTFGEFKKLLFLRYAPSVKCSCTKVHSAFPSVASLEKSNF
jgi:hypothetical protein